MLNTGLLIVLSSHEKNEDKKLEISTTLTHGIYLQNLAVNNHYLEIRLTKF